MARLTNIFIDIDWKQRFPEEKTDKCVSFTSIGKVFFNVQLDFGDLNWALKGLKV